MNRTGECNQCGSCCDSVRITAVLSHALKQHRSMEELILYYEYHQIEVMGTDPEKDYLFLEVNLPCTKLNDKNECDIHHQPELKPLLCHLYPTESDNEDCGYQFKK